MTLAEALRDIRPFAEWLEDLPAGQLFDVVDSRDCPLAGYLRASGFTVRTVCTSFVRVEEELALDLESDSWPRLVQRRFMDEPDILLPAALCAEIARALETDAPQPEGAAL